VTRLGLGLIGCGRIARRFHLPILSNLPAARLVAVADKDSGALSAAVEAAPGAVGVASTEDLLEVGGLDAVVICLPSHLHPEAAEAAFRASKHVYVEKPLAVALTDAQRLRDAWLASGLVGAVGFNFRFHPLYQRARELVSSGALGRLVAVRSLFTSEPRELPEWKLTRQTGGGALLDLASHHVDLIRYLFEEEVRAVTAAVRTGSGAEDSATMTLELDSGILAQVLTTLSTAQADRFDILGDVAALHIDRMGSRRLQIVPARSPASRSERLAAARAAVREGLLGTMDRLRPPAEHSFAAALSAFVGAAHGAPTTGATIEDGYRSLAIIEAAERAAATGERQPVPSATTGDRQA
jgi:predicted dehydrogenase